MRGEHEPRLVHVEAPGLADPVAGWAHYSLLATRYSLLATRYYSLLATRYSLATAYLAEAVEGRLVV
jgi:hypothetical protein